jgi:hypothetical protein
MKKGSGHNGGDHTDSNRQLQKAWDVQEKLKIESCGAKRKWAPV